MKIIIEIICVIILTAISIRSFISLKDNDGTFVILWFPIFCLPTIISIVAVINDII